MILSNRSMNMISHQDIGSPLFSLFLIRLFDGARGRGWRKGILARHILQSQKPDPMEKQVIQSNQDVYVCGIFLDETRIPFCITLSFILRYGLSFSFFLFLYIYASGHGHSSSAFSFAKPIFLSQYEESCQSDGVFLCGWEACFA